MCLGRLGRNSGTLRRINLDLDFNLDLAFNVDVDFNLDVDVDLDDNDTL